ncbi:WSC-domain-containing protein, partial [Teratosphaeria nubilosa]
LAIAAATAFISPAAAFWRMPCPGRLALERIDPIVAPGAVSNHVHTVSGGSGFGFNTTYEQQRNSACSSCPIKQDLSAYWTPKLYWMNEEGTLFEDVPQAGEGDGTTGGLTVYYEQRYSNTTDEKVLAFPENFRMLAGDPFQRNETNATAAPGQAVSFVCLDYSGVNSEQVLNMPDRNCPDGLRAQVYFPSCWDGVKLDSENHSSHMAYPVGGSYDNGACPPSHPVRLISIFFEVIYQTNLFQDRWFKNGSHPFVFAMGDRTGYGFHGDFVNGWDVNTLQDAIDQCTNDSGLLSDCPVFNDLFSDEECQSCRLPQSVNEEVTGNLTSLPGCQYITSGPAHATVPDCTTAYIGEPEPDDTDVTSSLDWEYVGCANDSTATRTFSGSSTYNDNMTVEYCINYCKGEGYSLAGLEYATQCYCDNKYCDVSREPNPEIYGQCLEPCAGDASQICGGASALSVYKSCDGGSCVNAMFHVN